MKNSASSNVVPSFASFSKFAKDYNRIPICLVFQSDLETPLSTYLKLAKGPNGFLLESVEKNEQVARYSIVGFEPSGIFEAKNGVLIERQGKRKTQTRSANPLRTIK